MPQEMMGWILVGVVVLVLLGLPILIKTLTSGSSNKRSETFKTYSTSKEYTYLERMTLVYPTVSTTPGTFTVDQPQHKLDERSVFLHPRGLALLTAGSMKIEHVVSGYLHDVYFELFDHHGSQKTSYQGARKPYGQTVIAFQVHRLTLPGFEMYPRPTGSQYHGLGTVLEIGAGRSFAEQYQVEHNADLFKDEQDAGGAAQVTTLFSADLLGFFEGHPGYSVEGYRGHLLVYRRKFLVEPQDLASYLDTALQVCQAFLQQA